jgi:hypothetical protein
VCVFGEKKINYSDNLESLFVSGSIVLAQKKKNNGKLFSMRFLGGFAQFFLLVQSCNKLFNVWDKPSTQNHLVLHKPRKTQTS